MLQKHKNRLSKILLETILSPSTIMAYENILTGRSEVPIN